MICQAAHQPSSLSVICLDYQIMAWLHSTKVYNNQTYRSFYMLETINIFHYEEFWRLQGSRELSHRCGGVLTLIIFLMLGGLIGYEMIQLTQLTNITASSQSQINFTSPLTNLSTYQNDPNVQPFMAALVIVDAVGKSFSSKAYKISASYSKQIFNTTTQSYQYSYISIPMESCTPRHFSKLPDAAQKFDKWGMGNWLCLPLDSTYEIGGNVLQYVKYIRVDVQCLSTNLNCIQNQGPLFPNLLTLNTFVNPNSNSEPLIAYLNRRQASLTQGFSSRNYIYLNRNILSTDSSLTPFEKYDYKFCFEEGSYTNSNVFSSSNPTATYYIILSGKTITSNRSYLKILTSLSFIGGLIAPLLTMVSLISMITKFGAFVYEMKFAKQFFKNNKSMKINYFGFIQQAVYSLLSKCCRNPDWELPKKRDQLKKTANNLLDVVYLQRRVAFLQRAISILFQKHQLTGLYLIKTTTKEEADRNYFYHQLRRNFLFYFKEKQQNGAKKPLEINLYPNQAQKSKNNEIGEKFSYFAENNKLINSRTKSIAKAANNKVLPNDRQNPMQYQNQRNNRAQSASILKKIDLGQVQNGEIREAQPEDPRDQYDSQYEKIVYLETQFVQQILSQIRQLNFEAQDGFGDWRSKRIYYQLDQKIKNMQYNKVGVAQAQSEI